MKNFTIVDAIRARAGQTPELRVFTFLEDGERATRHLTNGQVDAQACAIAARLMNTAAQGDRAILLYPPGIDMIPALLGCLYAGIILIPAAPPPPRQPPEMILGIVADAQPKLVLTTRELEPLLKQMFTLYPELHDIQVMATDGMADPTTAGDWQAPNLASDAVAALLYTSGSTKRPRGVILRHDALMQTLRFISLGTTTWTGSSFVSWTPLHHGSGLGSAILAPLLGGSHAVLMAPAAFLEQPIRWLNAISRYQAASSAGPNFAYQLCVERTTAAERENLDLSSWRQATIGTGPVHAETMTQFAETFAPYGFRRESFFVTYGLTEATMGISAKPNPTTLTIQRAALEQNRIVPVADSAADSVRFVSCGVPVTPAHLHIVNPTTLAMCPPDEIGEIWVAGSYAFAGYWNSAAETDATFRAYLDTGEGPFLRTGDMGFLHEGELYVSGRFKDMLIIRGRNFYSEDIEQVAGRAHPALMPGMGAAFSIPLNGEEHVAIVYEVNPDAGTVNVDEVAQAIRRAVAAEMQLPVEVVVLVAPSSLPRTSSNKIQRYLVRTQFLNNNTLQA